MFSMDVYNIVWISGVKQSYELDQRPVIWPLVPKQGWSLCSLSVRSKQPWCNDFEMVAPIWINTLGSQGSLRASQIVFWTHFLPPGVFVCLCAQSVQYILYIPTCFTIPPCVCAFIFFSVLCVKVVLFTRSGNLSCTPNELVILGA